MRTEEIRNKLKQTFKDVFKQDVNLTETTTANDIDSWDSLNHIILIKKIEADFQLEFDLFDIIELKNVGDIIHYIQKKLDADN